MHPDMPWFVKCPHCKGLMWIDELEEVGEIQPWDIELFENEDELPEELREMFSDVKYKAKLYDFPELQDYFAELKKGNSDREKEQYLRMRAWWAGNDKKRRYKVL